MTEQPSAPVNRPVFTPEQEARVREIVRDEIDADNALHNARSHSEFVIAQLQEVAARRELERKRTPDA